MVKDLKTWLGEDFFESLEKSYVYKPNTKTIIEGQELYVSMQVVPRIVLSWLQLHLKPMAQGQIVDLEIPFGAGVLHAHKLGPDVYNGYITHAGKQVTEFKFKSLPGVGLVLTSTYELYENEKIVDIEKKPEYNEKMNEVSKMIDDRIYLLDLVSRVVDQKISEREAINDMILKRMAFFRNIQSEEKVEENSSSYQNGVSKLKEFLDKRKL